MMRGLFLIGLLCAAMPANADMDDDPLLAMVHFEELEFREADSYTELAWEGDIWIGKDIDKFWLKTEGERAGGRTGDLETQLLYSRAVAAFWDFMGGARIDRGAGPERNWLTIGVRGEAPGLIETDAALFIGSNGRVAARLELAYELLVTQHIEVEPEVDFNWYSEDDLAAGIGAGFSSFEVGLHIRYHVSRELAPYIGFHWTEKFGDTRDIAREEGEPTDDFQFVAGVRFWF